MGNNTILKTTPIRIKLHNSLYNNPTFTTEFMNILNDYLTADLNSHVEIDSFDFQSKTMRILKNPELEKIELEGCIHMSLIYMTAAAHAPTQCLSSHMRRSCFYASRSDT